MLENQITPIAPYCKEKVIKREEYSIRAYQLLKDAVFAKPGRPSRTTRLRFLLRNTNNYILLACTEKKTIYNNSISLR